MGVQMNVCTPLVWLFNQVYWDCGTYLPPHHLSCLSTFEDPPLSAYPLFVYTMPFFKGTHPPYIWQVLAAVTGRWQPSHITGQLDELSFQLLDTCRTRLCQRFAMGTADCGPQNILKGGTLLFFAHFWEGAPPSSIKNVQNWPAWWHCCLRH